MNMKAVVAAGAAGAAVLAAAGVVYWEAGRWDAMVAGLVAEPPEGVKLDYVETGRTWRTRDFRLRADAGNGITALWTGRAEAGFGLTARLNLSLQEGLGGLIAGAGVKDYSDEIRVKTSLTGRLAPVEWHIGALSFHDGETGGECRTKPAVLRFEEREDAFRMDARLEALACRVDGEETTRLSDLRFEGSSRAGQPLADLSVSGGAFVADELSADGFRVSLRTEPAENGRKTEEKDPVEALWVERIEASVSRPRVEGEAADDIGFTARLSGLTESFITKVSEASGNASAHPANAWRLVALWQDAFLKQNVKLLLDDAHYERDGRRATLSGRIACESGEDGRMRYGVFQLAIPQELVAPESIAEPLSTGSLRLVDGVYRTKVDIDGRGIFANDVQVSDFSSFGLLLP